MFEKLRAIFREPDVEPIRIDHPDADAIWNIRLSDLPRDARVQIRSLTLADAPRGDASHARSVHASEEHDVRDEATLARVRGLRAIL